MSTVLSATLLFAFWWMLAVSFGVAPWLAIMLAFAATAGVWEIYRRSTPIDRAVQ